MPVVTIASVEAVQTKNGKTFYKLTDGNGQAYTTWKQPLYDAAKNLEGQQAEIESHTEEKNGYTNTYLDSIQPFTPVLAAAAGNGEVDWDGKDRRIARQASWKIAAQIMAGTIPAEATAKTAFNAVAPLAHAIEMDVYREEPEIG